MVGSFLQEAEMKMLKVQMLHICGVLSHVLWTRWTQPDTV